MTDDSVMLDTSSRDALITLEDARRATGLDLVSARETPTGDGFSYHDIEEESESPSHKSARDKGIGYFRSIGYHIFPEGVGVRGTYTFADFLAVREHRAVFVEVLSDTNIRPETLQKKAQLQTHGELCFVLFSGTKRSDESNLLSAKRAIESWADVLYCRLDGYGGNSIDHTYRASVAYDTTRNRGIRVAVAHEPMGKKKLAVSVKFLTHLYRNPANTLLSHAVLPLSYCYEEIFLDVFKQFAQLSDGRIKFTPRQRHVTSFRAMRRKSGLKMMGADGREVARLMSEYRGPPVEEQYISTYHPSSRDLPPEHTYGVFVLDNSSPECLPNLLTAIRGYGFKLEND
jgi:hypothetical protein